MSTTDQPTASFYEASEAAETAVLVRRFVDEQVVPLEREGFDDHGVRAQPPGKAVWARLRRRRSRD